MVFLLPYIFTIDNFITYQVSQRHSRYQDMMHTRIASLLLIIICTCAPITLQADEESRPFFANQPPDIASIFAKENSIANLKQLMELVSQLDDTYTNLYSNLKNGKKIVVFIDPAHGKLHNGVWQGESTGRVSCTGLPEEYYSILISRELYRKLRANNHLEVKSTDDFLDVMKGKSDEYKNIPFSETVRMAHNENAFIIISEHLNNISSIVKASGLMNIPGIHITTDGGGTRYLSYIKDTYRGFLTLYNKYDTTDFSRQYAHNLKDMLVAKGMKANSWDTGTVADDRFCYFVDFPISIIYETGFISNPEEEQMLRQPEMLQIIAEAQYEALIATIRDIFGVDISGREPVLTQNKSDDMHTFFKLSRMALLYIRLCEPQKAAAIITLMEKKYPQYNQRFAANYRTIRRILLQAENYYATSKRLMRAKNYKKATRYIYLAKKTLRNKPVFDSLYAMYSGEYASLGVPETRESDSVPVKKPTSISSAAAVTPQRATLTTPIIFAIEENESIESALMKALNPDRETLVKLMKSFSNIHTTSRVKTRVKSGRGGKASYAWKTVTEKVNPTAGIYIVKLNRDLEVAHIRRVKKVQLAPWKYQNHQYLKNSCFAFEQKQRTL